jgi:YggT family protein
VVDMLYRLTEPLLRPIRRFLPNLGGVDISPIILLLGLYFLESLLHEYVWPALIH